MSLDQNQQKGLFWTPRGGNNAQDIWASCHTFSSVTENRRTGELEKTTLIVDMGQHETPWIFQSGAYDKVVPALDDCLNIPGEKQADNEAQAVFLTHCHSDHIAGIYEYLRMGAKLPAVYGSEYTLNTLRKGLIDNGIKKESWPEMKSLSAGDVVRVGNMTVEAFPASHSIPGCFSFKISNEEGSIFHSGDTKADETSFLGRGVDLSSYGKIAQNGGVDLMTFDATATHLKGHAAYESEIFDAYKKLFKEYAGRQVIAALPAAHMERLASVVCAAQAAGRDVIINGGASLDSNIMALKLSGYDLQEKCPDIKIVSALGKEAKNVDVKNSITITTGIYMEKNSPFIRSLQGENDQFFMANDAVVIAPTSGDKNEKLHLLLKSKKFSGIKVVTSRQNPKIYGSGHAQADDFKKLARHICPKTVAPMHCSAEKAGQFNRLAAASGFKTLPVYPHNGSTVAVDRDNGCCIVDIKMPQWFGVKHHHQPDGSITTTAEKVADNGYSAAANNNNPALRARQEQAMRKIADYRQKQALAQTVSLIGRRKYER